MHDSVKAAAERLIEEAAIHIEAVVSGGHDPLTDDILTVARYALEAGQEVARMKEALEDAHTSMLNYLDDERIACRCWDGNGCDPHELLLNIEQALSTPGEPESSGGG